MQQRQLAIAAEARAASGRIVDAGPSAFGRAGGPDEGRAEGGPVEPLRRVAPVVPIGPVVPIVPVAPIGPIGPGELGALAALGAPVPAPAAPPAPSRSSAHVPSEELWHAAIRAALQAAETAAELRRSLLADGDGDGR